ncbi:MAG: biotin/lipoyl-containing protein [Tepidiforma sp.]
MAEKFLVRTEESASTWEIERDDEGIRVRREGQQEWTRVELQRVGDSQLYLLMLEHRPVEIYLERRRGGARATIGRHAFDFNVERWRPQAAKLAAQQVQTGLRRITAPMTGSIVEVRCKAGDRVAPGDVLLVIESMKMNNELRSPAAGLVEQVAVTGGQRVNAGDLLVALHLG